ncbi:MAG: DUF362 domain-containing protein [Candidatus Latescibacterota bacterium]
MINTSKNRREFLIQTPGIIGLGIVAGGVLQAEEASAATGKSKVIVVRNPKAITARNICDRKQAALMIEKALLNLTGKTSTIEAWAALGVTKNDVVGIKPNCNGAQFPLYGHSELVYALCDTLTALVAPNNIIIYERYTSELSRAGFNVNQSGSGIRCHGTDKGGGFDEREGLTRIVTDTCTKLINLPSLKVFSGFGGSLFLKNHIGSIAPGEMSRCHGNTEFISQVCAQPGIKNKTVLALCDGLRGTYTDSDPWYWGGILVSRDQVAAEYTALQVINEKRRAEKMSPIEIPEYVRLADTRYNLGTVNPANMEISRIEM